jgi:hypothetical protein
MWVLVPYQPKSILLDPIPRPSWYKSFEKEQINTRARPWYENLKSLECWEFGTSMKI